MTDEPTKAEIAAIRERMTQPLSKEQIVATELFLQIETADRPVSTWTNDDWLRLARHMIKCVELARDISAEDMAEAMNNPPEFPLPTFEELDAMSHSERLNATGRVADDDFGGDLSHLTPEQMVKKLSD